MFGQLILTGDTDTGDAIRWDMLVSSSGVLPDEPLDAGQARPYLETVSAIVEAVYAGQPVDKTVLAERQRVEQAVRQLVPWLTEGDLEPPQGFDFTVRCAIAHHRLPAQERQAREARIAAILDGMLPAPADRVLLKTRWDALKVVAVVVPDPMMASELRSNACTEITRAHNEGLLTRSTLLAPVWRALQPAQGKLTDFDRVAMIVTEVYLTRPPAEQAAFLALLSRLGKANQCGWFLQVQEAIEADFGDDINIADQGTIHARVLAGWINTRDPALRQSILRYELDRMHGQDRMRIVQMVQMLLDAVEAGVPLGDAYVARVRRCLLDEAQAIDTAQQGIDAGTLRNRRIAEQAVEQPPEDARDVPDEDPVHAWSVSRLLTWIEGPVTQKPLDRRRIAARERARRSARQARARTGDDDPASEADDGTGEAEHTDDDIDLVVDDALQATAAFLLGDLQDLLSLATRLKLPAAQLDAARRAREAVARIAGPQGIAQDHDDQDTLAALAAAEKAIANLRGRIRGAQADDQQRMAFTDALARALKSEPLEWGKRHGGVIACPLPLTSWAWVHQEFHGRWLFDQRQLAMNGHVVPLRPDQALALYVTGTSLSEFAFDVSVHLWQRRPGSVGPASRDEGGWLLMNRTDWYDTYIPCAVLHVPRGS